MEENTISIEFKYKNEFDSKTELKVEITAEQLELYDNNLEYMVSVFKRFLVAADYSQQLVDKIQIIE